MNIFSKLCVTFCIFHICNCSASIDTTVNNSSHNLNINMEAKLGNKRNIYNTNIMVPLIRHSDSLVFTNIIGMLDSKSSKEINLGIGMRYLYPQYIIGTYIYYDYRKTKYNTYVQQITLGSELFFSAYEFRVNFYLPLSSGTVIGKNISLQKETSYSHTTLSTISNDILATPLAGADIEMGLTIPEVKRLSLFGGGYYFHGKNVSTIKGANARANFNILSWLNLTFENSYDNHRKYTWFVGLKLSLKIGKPLKQNALTKKMIQPPIRDVDVKVANQSRTRAIYQQTFEGSTVIDVNNPADLNILRQADPEDSFVLYKINPDGTGYEYL